MRSVFQKKPQEQAICMQAFIHDQVFTKYILCARHWFLFSWGYSSEGSWKKALQCAPSCPVGTPFTGFPLAAPSPPRQGFSSFCFAYDDWLLIINVCYAALLLSIMTHRKHTTLEKFAVVPFGEDKATLWSVFLRPSPVPGSKWGSVDCAQVGPAGEGSGEAQAGPSPWWCGWSLAQQEKRWWYPALLLALMGVGNPGR